MKSRLALQIFTAFLLSSFAPPFTLLSLDIALCMSSSVMKENTNRSRGFIQWFAWVFGLAGASFMGLLLLGSEETKFDAQEVSTKANIIIHDKDTCMATICPSLDPVFESNDDLNRLMERATKAKEKVREDLEQKYGTEYFKKLFLDEHGESIGKKVFTAPNYTPGKEDISRTRFLRKLMLKILNVQLQYQHCNCQSSGQNQRNLQKQALPIRFVWATGGHSASAGHGNYHDESYTAVMEQTAKQVFAQIGIDLEGRNHAMGGMVSAPELALCNEAVYGLDADVISWDFGMTDGRGFWRKNLYGHRIGMHRNRPAIFDLGVFGGRQSGGRLQELTKLQDLGLAGLAQRVDLFQDRNLKEALPDMQTIASAEEMEALPEYVRHFRCGNELEKGDPTCNANKFTPTKCVIKGRVGWHPGWKSHALTGNLMAVFLIDSLLEALETLATLFEKDDTQSPQSMFDTLQAQEDEDYALFFNASITTVDPDMIAADKVEQIDTNILYRSRAMCHTAILPSTTRYLGIMTDTRDTSSYDHFEEGTDFKQPAVNGTWRLAIDGGEHDRIKSCPRTDRIDFKDWFFVQTDSGVASLTIPNQAEKEVYLGENHEFDGYIVMALVTCPWGRCAQGTMTWDHVNDGNVTMSVNGEPVTEATNVNNCVLLKGKDGYSWKANANGQYTLTMQIHPPNSFMKISSVMLL